jgi:hypothetical protein
LRRNISLFKELSRENELVAGQLVDEDDDEIQSQDSELAEIIN